MSGYKKQIWGIYSSYPLDFPLQFSGLPWNTHTLLQQYMYIQIHILTHTDYVSSPTLKESSHEHDNQVTLIVKDGKGEKVKHSLKGKKYMYIDIYSSHSQKVDAPPSLFW